MSRIVLLLDMACLCGISLESCGWPMIELIADAGKLNEDV